MNFNLVDILTNVLRSRILPLVTRLKLFLSPTYLVGRVSELLRRFLSSILNVRPRDKDDYYPIARWLVSKRLAYALVIITGLLCIIYLITARSALFPGRSEDNIKTYDYNSILLKFAKGRVRIRGKSGYMAFEGEVSDAACNGTGTLKNPAGVVVYEGQFESSKYEGSGIQYYEDGTKEYEGFFHQNLYSGEGKFYRPTGSLLYDGMFAQNMKEGHGKLYNNGGQAIFEGEFSKDEILYSSLLGKGAAEMAQSYTGERKLYVIGNEHIRVCEDISCMTEELLDENSIDEEAKVEVVYVMQDFIHYGGKRYEAFKDLESIFGEATYTGESYATLAELLMINRLNDASEVDVIGGPAEITETQKFTEYTQVSGYDENYVVWLHSYEKDGLVYNFVSAQDDNEFAFYYILNNDLSEEK
ncbi:MAG: hypothetical protein IJT32_03085 [Lachnospiraceae bacterium]|nr:hypothetical protein [Lachnospiraceae bacterium]